ncbi:WD40/YVTN/BNR-like repeat-containing protein [Puia dinghuensis]|uniref:Sortilin N-terminal domain-containing protein n=1 Tax=Puia dinghuensis TaxID=1792502 RepID=A0A8J2XVG1_9BACT|nr:glycosyl hydrolase [Puia dinghuensis]GGB18246.1 hypothetical protein GCM10011511_47600 [Puia dinghuensis]
MMKLLLFVCMLSFFMTVEAQKRMAPAAAAGGQAALDGYFKPLKWRNVGPFRGGRSVTSCGVTGNPMVYYMGTTGGGVWKTVNAGWTWANISDGFFKTGSVGAVAVAESDPNVVYVGMGEHAPRGVMSSYGDGVYRSVDAGKTWKKMGLDATMHISAIRIHPQNSDIVYVAAQGAMYGATEDRGVYQSTDGGVTWKKIFYVDENTGCVDLSMDKNNPRVLYAAMWDYRRLPWQMRSGGKGSGLYKSIDGGQTWTRMEKGLPKEMGKMGISVSGANSNKVYALIESSSEKEEGGLFASDDAGKSWTRVSKDHRLVQRAWYYIEVFADPQNENVVYVLNSPGLKSIDGGRTWSNLGGTHGDYHQLWINPHNDRNMIISNDGGAAITFDDGATWSTQNNQPTAQLYRVNADNLFPYNLYAGQQDNTSVMIASRNTAGGSIGDKNWFYSAGGESAFLAFDPDSPRYIMGGSYQGTIEILDRVSGEGKSIMVAPIQYQSLAPKDMKYRFNWNAPIVCSQWEPYTFYHGGNRLFKTVDGGRHWEVVSPDLTRHDTAHMGISGVPYTNEGAGGENYCTLAYVKESPQEKGVIWTGSDDGVVSLTRDGGKTWSNVTPPGLEECLVNCIEVSPHDKATAYIATTRYKFNDLAPAIYKTTDYGKSWRKISAGIPYGAYTRTVREDDVRKDLLYAGTETGFYISYDGGNQWQPLQLNLPVTPVTDLLLHKGNLIASTMGRGFWILDDLNVLRGYNAATSRNDVLFYPPGVTYRVSGGSELDRVVKDEDEEAPRAAVAGTNPATGVVLYYQLPSTADTSKKLTLAILNESGDTVRQYSSKEDEGFVHFPGGPSPDPVLPLKAGLNRMVWDMRYPTLPGVPTVFIEGDYAGRKVAPGQYQARLKYDTMVRTVSFVVLGDPRINATAADYAAQQEWMAKTEKGIREIHESVLRIRKVRRQMNEVVDLLGDRADMKDVADSGKKISGRLLKWEEELVQNKAQSNDDIINFINKLSADYIFLKGEMDVNIPYVTDGQKERYAELDAQWQVLKGQMKALLDKEVAGFNALCRERKLEKVLVPEK